jgi:hypothetical protein
MNSVTLDNISVGVVAQILPILSIFGQDLTNTFLRESLSWSDYIIFAVGPLGIIWVLTAILKTIGPEKLKKYIQNSYDEPLIEQALMSSTSSEVCELWNGREVVRLIRKAPRIREFFVINGELYDSKKIKDKYQDVDGYFKPRGDKILFFLSPCFQLTGYQTPEDSVQRSCLMGRGISHRISSLTWDRSRERKRHDGSACWPSFSRRGSSCFLLQ